ncbi:MAG: tetratricopeptide repeat protein [Candidatus Eisenbacteria bacterium]|uniref:Tetratricopeptide repeat protein n=1 Tax=Eiseniibacteriota bacterium TaxID=2212470 RepID=A0A933SI80_UNCEI|nr:tetratricopeptide repeat protein [Candidatus Eisenbacteria bacterium]
MDLSRSHPETPREAALRLVAEQQYTEAVLWLERALARSEAPDERQAIANTLSDVATAARDSGDLVQAQRALELATSCQDWADLHCRLGAVLAERGRRAEARQAFDRALALNPRYRAAAVERALLDARDGRIAEAMQTLRAMAADQLAGEPGAFERGLERLGEADFEDAAPLLHRGLEPTDAWIEEQLHAYQALVYDGDMVGALQHVRAAALERPGYPDLHLLLGAHELQMGATDDALESLSRALELNPDYHAARVEFARALESVGDTPQALVQLEMVLAGQPGHAEARQLHERLTARRRGGRTATASSAHRS